MPAWKSIRNNVNTFRHDSMWDDFLIYLFTLEAIIYLLTCVWSQKSDKLKLEGLTRELKIMATRKRKALEENQKNK